MARTERQITIGRYQGVNTGRTSWTALRHGLALRADRPHADLRAVRMADLTRRVRRPHNAAMANDTLRDAGIAMP